jgi:uncharacterized protein involved in exopolysaccharide biosynthesis
MESNNNQDEISLKEFIIQIQDWGRFLFSKWAVLLAAFVIGGIIGLGYAFLQKPSYTASLSFVLEGENAGGSTNAIGLANSLGLDISGSAGSVFSGSNLIELMKSRAIIEKALLKPIVNNGKTQTFAQYYLHFNEHSESWNTHSPQKPILFPTDIDRTKFTLRQDSILGEIFTNVSQMITVGQKDKKGSLLSIDVRSSDELFSKEFAEKLVDEVSSYYIEIKSKKARENFEILQSQTDSIRRVLNGSIVSVAKASDNTFALNPAMQVQKTTISKKQFDVQANTSILMQLVANLEMAKVTLRKETPLIQVIDKPILPLKKEKVSIFKPLLLSSFFTTFFSILFFIFKKVLTDILT